MGLNEFHPPRVYMKTNVRSEFMSRLSEKEFDNENINHHELMYRFVNNYGVFSRNSTIFLYPGKVKNNSSKISSHISLLIVDRFPKPLPFEVTLPFEATLWHSPNNR